MRGIIQRCQTKFMSVCYELFIRERIFAVHNLASLTGSATVGRSLVSYSTFTWTATNKILAESYSYFVLIACGKGRGRGFQKSA